MHGNQYQTSKKESIASVKARCFDPATGKPVGRDIPHEHQLCSYLDAKYKYKFDSEMDFNDKN